jgi:hypothetical protein
MQSYQVII